MSNQEIVNRIHKAMKQEKSYIVFWTDGEKEHQSTLSEADMNAILSAGFGGQVLQVKIETREVGKTHLRPDSESQD